MAVIASPKKSTSVRKVIRFAALRTGYRLGSWFMPAMTLQRAFRLFGTPLPGGRQRARQSDPAGARIHELPFGRERITVYVWGDTATQPTVLLAHGWSGYGLFFLPWVQALRRAGYAVATFDQIAHGRSSGYRATLPMFADVLHRVATHLGPLAVVIGHSLGGAATMLALSRGIAAERAILIAPAADPGLAARRFGSMIGLAPHLSGRLFEEFESLTGICVDALQAHINAPHIARAALIVHDLEDREVPWAEGERYARYWPDARLLTTTGLGHNRVVNAPSVIAGALHFLQGQVVGDRVVSSPNLPYGWA